MQFHEKGTDMSLIGLEFSKDERSQGLYCPTHPRWEPMKYDFQPDRYCCAVEQCPVFIPAELVDRWLNPEKYEIT